MTPKEAIEFAKKNGAKMVDLKFCDLLGTWQHFSVPIWCLDESNFEEGFGFDGSSIRSWQAIHTSDMLVVPDPDTAFMEPFCEQPTISFICNVVDPITKEFYSRDPRYIAQKAEIYLKSTRLADIAYFGPEAEFFIFNDIRFDQNERCGYYFVDSIEGRWNSGREENPNLGYKPRYKEGYLPVAPMDKFQDLRTEMILEMQKIGVEAECHHHEVATAGQAEIDMRFGTLVKMGDSLMKYKYVIKNVAIKKGFTVTFMPKPIFNDSGSGMHVHQSLWKDGQNLFAGDRYGGLSEMAFYYIGGILKHAPALCAFTNPTTNSYKRLVPGFEAPINLAYSSRNRSAGVRIPMYSPLPEQKRVEVRFPDPSCNGYLAFAAMLMAGLDGIENKIHPGEPLDKDIYSLTPEELKDVPSTPGSLEEAIKALEADYEFLLKGNVFTKDVIEKWIERKKLEISEIQLRPHPWEFALYYDI